MVAVTVEAGVLVGAFTVPVHAAFSGQQAGLLSGSKVQVDRLGQQRLGKLRAAQDTSFEPQFPAWRGRRPKPGGCSKGLRKGEVKVEEEGGRMARMARRKMWRVDDRISFLFLSRPSIRRTIRITREKCLGSRRQDR